ncbi:hypothetical protein HXX76_003078 [Chlamydomonas incerta]|uniref:Protein kinase domain-containing protein n=1 Tax=Chlamydomonas incerta TaxID=51695 RepID=A0A835TMG5_CHLIN|nr:hypothetical protein HXX76_003078 [Chlamydomonas incerta]|eukprot:KAG2441456.1 hypothetical protein HXX76_003078 [Chlamydomonas incerta]
MASLFADADFEPGTAVPFVLGRNISVTSSPALPDIATIRLYAGKKLKLGGNASAPVWLSFTRVALHTPQKDNLARAPHLYILERSEPRTGATLVTQDVVLYAETCNPISYRGPNMASLVATVVAAQAAGKLPAYPTPDIILAVNQTGCVNTSLSHPTVPILSRCWPNDIIGYTLPVVGQELNAAGVPEPTYYVWSIRHLFAPCMRQADEACVAQYGPIGCNAYAINNVTPLPIAAMELDNSTAGASGSGGNSSTVGIIVGCVVGGVAFALLAAAALVAVRVARRRRRESLYSTQGSSEHEECLTSGGSAGEHAGCGDQHTGHLAAAAAAADGSSKRPEHPCAAGNGFGAGKDCESSGSVQHSRKSVQWSGELPSADGIGREVQQQQQQQQQQLGTAEVQSGSVVEQAAADRRQQQQQVQDQQLLRARSAAEGVIAVCGSPNNNGRVCVSLASAGVLADLRRGGSALFGKLPPFGADPAGALQERHMPIIPASPYRADVNFNINLGSASGGAAGGAGSASGAVEAGPGGLCDTGSATLAGSAAPPGAWRYNSMGSVAGSTAAGGGLGSSMQPHLQHGHRNPQQQQQQQQIAALQAIKHQNARRAPPASPAGAGSGSGEAKPARPSPVSPAPAAPPAPPAGASAAGLAAQGPEVPVGPRQQPLLPPLPEELPSCEPQSSSSATPQFASAVSTITRVIVPPGAAQSIGDAAAAAGSSAVGGGAGSVWGGYRAAAHAEAAAAAAAAMAAGGAGGASFMGAATYVSEDGSAANRNPPTSPTPSTASSCNAAADALELLPVVRGRGAFGRVVEGIYRGERVAVKMLLGPGDGAATGAQGLQDALRQEVEVLGRCSHPNVVKLLAACLDPRQPCLVMELCDTSLEALIFKRGGPGAGPAPAPAQMPLATVLTIAIDICNALSYLHPTIIHRDLKPANVLINGAGSGAPVAKLTDFGLSRLRAMTLPTMDPEAGTAAYMAPECFDVTNRFVTHHADLYSLGVIIWAMLTGAEPWSAYSVVVVAFRVCAKGERLPLACLPDARCPVKLKKLIIDLWDADPRRRPAAEEVAKELILMRKQLLAVEGRGSKD